MKPRLRQLHAPEGCEVAFWLIDGIYLIYLDQSESPETDWNELEKWVNRFHYGITK